MPAAVRIGGSLRPGGFLLVVLASSLPNVWIIGAGILLMRPDWGQGTPVVRFEFVIECRVPEEINCLGDIKISDIGY